MITFSFCITQIDGVYVNLLPSELDTAKQLKDNTWIVDTLCQPSLSCL